MEAGPFKKQTFVWVIWKDFINKGFSHYANLKKKMIGVGIRHLQLDKRYYVYYKKYNYKYP